ncbi:Monocarboxylate transporter [Mycena indigotica]|uniref:Monocarboxylate transporter n=1 Tax=Mycena indigotica TaxID=2126181 RepID=A0A8H6VWV0_9AGAR|nr:Monocarboxylate transporter [Mycena indigotica]KAF7293088.1 Monocarboxylate transporter [Mycena indigotica]
MSDISFPPVYSSQVPPVEAMLPSAGPSPLQFEVLVAAVPNPAMLEKGLDPEITSQTSSKTTTYLDDEPNNNNVEWTYPDGGLRAWLVVAGCFIMAMTCMGWGLVWGVFEDYYHTTRFPGTPLSQLSLVGGSLSFSMTFSSYLFGGIGERYLYQRMIALSCLLGYICLLGSAFATEKYQIFLLQGCLLGLSYGISMPLYMALPSQWFLTKRGVATGIAVAGSGIGGGIESLIVRQLLSKLGYRRTMLIYSNMYALLQTLAWFMMAERRAPGAANIKKRWLPRTINASYYSVALSVFVGIFGYLSPYYFITTYVKAKVPSLDPKSLIVVAPLVVMNFSGGLGRIVAGRLSDRFGPINMFFTSFFLGGLSQIFIWTFANSYAAVMVFSVVYGFVGCWFLGLLPVVCAQLFGMNDLATLTGFLVLANSPGKLQSLFYIDSHSWNPHCRPIRRGVHWRRSFQRLWRKLASCLSLLRFYNAGGVLLCALRSVFARQAHLGEGLDYIHTAYIDRILFLILDSVYWLL